MACSLWQERSLGLCQSPVFGCQNPNVIMYYKTGIEDTIWYSVVRIYTCRFPNNNNGGWFYEGMAPETKLNIKFSGIKTLLTNTRTAPHPHYTAIDCLNKFNAFNIPLITPKYISHREILKYRCHWFRHSGKQYLVLKNWLLKHVIPSWFFIFSIIIS